MATANPPAPTGALQSEQQLSLSRQWRRLTWVATFVALLSSPSVFFWYHRHNGWSVGWSIVATLLTVVAFRGLIDVLVRRLIPWPSLFGNEDARLREDDVVARRRAWTWRFVYRWVVWVGGGVTLWFVVQLLEGDSGISYGGTWGSFLGRIGHFLAHPGSIVQLLVTFFIFFIFNFLILMGPLMWMGISQVRGYEPGDAEWGVRLDHVRGQAEAKEEVRRIVNLWQSGEAFEKAGGKRERGILFLGAPGTGKTMLAKAIATGFNSPFVSIPGSGFAQTFIGIDALIVRFLARKAKKLARKWGGQCIVFIDEIDAVGMRRQALQGQSMVGLPQPELYGAWGALNPSGDLIVENEAWREAMFARRAPERRSPYPPWFQKLGNLVNQGALGGMFGGMGQLALNQLLVTMDGIDNPPFLRRFLTSKINALLDASYVVPRRLGRVSLRLPPPRPLGAQIYFIGATNVPMEVLDPALTRPGRMGRHVWFRTPTKDDRKDIFDLYLQRVAHDPELDAPERRDEIARVTNGYSPAMIEQICSMALTNAHHEGLTAFTWQHLVDAMTSIESGTAVGIRYVAHETRAVAIHEAGHATTAHVYRPDLESSRLSIRMRGGSLGHHQAFQKEERFSQWQSEAMGDLIHVLGAMAAEHVFYGETSSGVGGDLQYATARVATMVGAAGMGPLPLNLGATTFADESPEQTRERIQKRFEKLGMTLMNRTRGSADFHADPVASVLQDPFKRATAAQILGQAFLTAHEFVAANRAAVEKIADAVIEKEELYGDDLNRLLDSVQLVKPEIDWTREDVWPQI